MTVPCVQCAQTLSPVTAEFLNRETMAADQGMGVFAADSVSAPPFMQARVIKPRTVSGPIAGVLRR